MDISGINGISSLINNSQIQNANNDNKSGSSFADILKNSIAEVNNTQVEGYKAMQGIATGNVPNLQEAVHKISEAETTLKLALEVKNKAISAYKEIMKMSV